VYQTNKDSGFYYYNGNAWLQLASGDNIWWKKNGNAIYNTNSGNVGIGLIAPTAKLQVADSSVMFTNNTTVFPATFPNPPQEGERHTNDVLCTQRSTACGRH
jgi:phosphoserine aminotransferase